MVSTTQQVSVKNIIAGGIVVLVIGKHTLTLKNVLFAQTKSMRKVCVRTITNNGDEQIKVVSFGRQKDIGVKSALDSFGLII